ncbi:hypothetical protein NXV57_15910 [Bacteroides thetaiotaomicron]|nr:hypothetical protein [Bacteroides thetaiotaomicron]
MTKLVDKGETNAVVRSTYQAVYDEILDADDVRIADDATLVEFGDGAHYAETFDACKKKNLDTRWFITKYSI